MTVRSTLARAALACALACLLPPAVFASQPASLGPTTAVQVVRDLAYGRDRQQRIDAYVPLHPAGPVLVLVHGGAWAAGDKATPAMIRPKVSYWTARGYVVVSVNYRLLPAASPLVQAQDVARALALVQQKAPEWDADPKRVVLMGHSSGGHLVALLTAAPSLAYAQGARPWPATVNLDGAALDVPKLMRQPHARMYDRAFGRDPAFWASVSPYDVMERKPLPQLLIVCSRLRGDSCPQADAYERKASPMGHRLTIWMQPLSHMAIDRQLGLPGPYTDSVARWISSIL
jgi:acetyl esterase/lipase